MASGKHVHLIGICGTGDGVAGRNVARAGASRYGIGHSSLSADERSALCDGDSNHGAVCGCKSLTSVPDLVVVGNAISRGNPELERVLDERIPMTSMAAVIHDEFLLGARTLRGLRDAWQDDDNQHARMDS